jgi:hypothetical protein
MLVLFNDFFMFCQLHSKTTVNSGWELRGAIILGEHENFIKTAVIRIRNFENTKQGSLPYLCMVNHLKTLSVAQIMRRRLIIR